MNKYGLNGNFIIIILLALLFPLSTTFGANNDSLHSSHSSMSEQSMSNCMHMMANSLGPKDANYDKRFIDQMIEHHQGAIVMAKDALKNASHPELRKLAENIITAQTQEIDQMKMWRKEWYGS